MIDLYALAAVHLMEHRRALREGCGPVGTESFVPTTIGRSSVAERIGAWLGTNHRRSARPGSAWNGVNGLPVEGDAKC